MTVLRIAAFSDGNKGGNPAGVWIGDDLPSESTMQAIAAEVGFSETAFAAPAGGAWRVRYFSPACEVPFCGHATIALGAALALQHGDRTFELTLNRAKISVAGRRNGLAIAASLDRILVTHDVRTMPRHFGEFASKTKCPGLILIPRSMPIGVAIEELLLIWNVSEPEEWINLFRRLPL